jgi:DNA repair photolyase
MRTIKGKAIYNPSGKAVEYSYWACNFYVGCSNGCEYCYLKNGVLSRTMGGDKPILKKCFRDENHALEVFEKELLQNLPELQKHGLFFTFTSDPFLPETMLMTEKAMIKCIDNNVNIKLLSKKAIPVKYARGQNNECRKSWFYNYKERIAFGFTLTGHDELEPNASPNAERIEAMQKLHEVGFKTWASIEPIIDFKSSLKMLGKIYNFCDLAKIGLESGKKYNQDELLNFIKELMFWAIPTGIKFYFKDSLLKAAGISREDLPANCVTRDYNIFNNK